MKSQKNKNNSKLNKARQNYVASMNLKYGVFYFVLMIVFMFGSISLADYDFSKEPTITLVDCYDANDNLINGLKCEESNAVGLIFEKTLVLLVCAVFAIGILVTAFFTLVCICGELNIKPNSKIKTIEDYDNVAFTNYIIAIFSIILVLSITVLTYSLTQEDKYNKMNTEKIVDCYDKNKNKIENVTCTEVIDNEYWYEVYSNLIFISILILLVSGIILGIAFSELNNYDEPENIEKGGRK